MENSRGRSAGRAGTSGDGSAERPDVAFARSKLSEDVRDMLWVPHEAEDPSFGRDDPDEGWSFDPASGLMDPRASPPATADCDDRTAARALRGLARASLKRIRAGDMTVRDDGAAHANLLSTLMEEIRGGGRTDGPTSTYHALALSLAAVERRCVDLYVSTGGTSRGTSPMLSEVLASEEFSAAIARQRQGRDDEATSDASGVAGPTGLGALLWALQRALHPRCMNLRNVVWHGFIAPPDAQPELAALALALAASVPSPVGGEGALGSGEGALGLGSEAGTGRTLARHDAELVDHVPERLARDGWWRTERAVDEAAEIVASSAFVPDGWRDATAMAARDLIERGDDARFVAVACPALESALREMFVAVNDAPEALVARLGEYYATLDGFGQSRVHDVILHPRRAPIDPARPDARRPNALPSKLPPGARNALEDLFMRDRGPALRAAYAHGSVSLDPRAEDEKQPVGGDGARGGDGACVRLLLLIVLDMCVAGDTLVGFDGRSDGNGFDSSTGAIGSGPTPFARPTLVGYDARFHPSVRFRASLEGAFRSIRPIAGPSPRFTCTFTANGDGDGRGGEALVLVFDSEAGGEDGKPNSRAGFTEKTDKLGNDSESQETALREIVNVFLDVGDDPDSSSVVLARWVFGDEKVVAAAVTDRPPPAGPFVGAEALRAAADEVASASTAYMSWIERLVGAAERREARSNQRRQLFSLLKHQKSVALGLCALLLAAERMERVAGGCASDEAEIGASTTKLLSHAASVRAACEAGQGAEAARAAAGAWQTKAGRALLETCVRA